MVHLQSIGRVIVSIFLYQKEGYYMDSRIGDLRYKEVINVTDGSRYGYVGDVEVDLETGQIRTLIVPGRLRFFGLLGREDERVFPWSAIRRFGEDIILVEGDVSRFSPHRKR